MLVVVMGGPALDIVDILRDRGSAWREAGRGHINLNRLKAKSAIEGDLSPIFSTAAKRLISMNHRRVASQLHHPVLPFHQYERIGAPRKRVSPEPPMPLEDRHRCPGNADCPPAVGNGS